MAEPPISEQVTVIGSERFFSRRAVSTTAKAALRLSAGSPSALSLSLRRF